MYCGGGIMYCGGGTMYCGAIPGYCGIMPGCCGIIIGCCGIISGGASGARPARLKSGSNISAILFLRTALFVLFKDEVDEDGDKSPIRPIPSSSRATIVASPSPSPTSPSSAVPKILSRASLYARSRSSLVGGFPETFASPPFASPPLIDRPAACSPLDRTRTTFFFTDDATDATTGASPSSPGGVGSASSSRIVVVVRPSSICPTRLLTALHRKNKRNEQSRPRARHPSIVSSKKRTNARANRRSSCAARRAKVESSG